MTEAVQSLVQNWPQDNRKYIFFPLNKPQLLLRKQLFFILKGNTMYEMSSKVHAKVSFKLVRLISIKSVQVFQILQILKPDKNNVSQLSNWLIVSFSPSEPCNPKIISHFLTNYLENWELRIFFDYYSGHGICFCLFVFSQIKRLDPLKNSYINL